VSAKISPLSAASHYAASAAFWEDRAKMLQHQLDQALVLIDELEKVAPPADPPSPDPLAEPEPTS
jgi:hypothetical protein